MSNSNSSAVMTANPLLAEANYKPMLFSTPMVQAILDGRKTMTRRIVKFPKDWVAEDNAWDWAALREYYPKWGCSFKIGDIIWVRETWQQHCIEVETDVNTWAAKGFEATGQFVYRADNYELPKESIAFGKWKPSLFMPKNACRLFLEITEIKLERLQSISNTDAEKEGIEVVETIDTLKFFKRYSGENITFNTANAYYSFKTLWHKINGVVNWESNPFVWVYTFKQVECPKGFC
jgi:hypothetical protein